MAKRKVSKILKVARKKATVKKASTEMAIVVPHAQKSLVRSLLDPHDVMSFGKVLKGFITENNLSVKIDGTDYAKVDGWKFAGMNFGLTAIPGTPKKLHTGEYITILYVKRTYAVRDKKTNTEKTYEKDIPVFAGFSDKKEILDDIRLHNKISRELTRPYFSYSCECDIIRLSDQQKVGGGTAFCSNLEFNRVNNDEYSIIAMVQTRVIGRAFRNLIGYVMNAADMGETPAEEMENIDVNAKADQAPSMPIPTTEQFNKSFKRVMTGEIVASTVEKFFTLNEDQRNSLKIAEENAPKKVVVV